jgi:hypothetical protein
MALIASSFKDSISLSSTSCAFVKNNIQPFSQFFKRLTGNQDQEKQRKVAKSEAATLTHQGASANKSSTLSLFPAIATTFAPSQNSADTV